MDPEPAGAPSPSENYAQVACPSGPWHPWGHRQHHEPLEAFLGLLLEILILWI